MAIRTIISMALWLVASFALAQSVEPAKPVKLAKTTLAIGATLDAQQRIWLARVENRQLWVSVSDNSGAHFSTPVAVTREQEDILADGENRPKIAVAANGTVLVTWTQALPKKFSGNIRFARSIDGGKSFSAPITVNDDRSITSHRFESLAIDGQGRVAIAWLDARDRDAAKARGEAFAGASVYVAQSSDHGASFGANRRLAQHTCECCRTALSWSADGPVLLWRNLFDTNTRDFAWAYLDRGGVNRVSDDDWRIDACPHHGGGIAVDGRDALHLVWFTNGSKRQGLFYKRISGAAETPPLAFGSPDAQAGHPSVVAARDLVLIAWREFDGKGYAAMALRSNDGGASWSAPLRLAQANGAADYPIPLTDGRRALVLWHAAQEGLRVLPVPIGSAP